MLTFFEVVMSDQPLVGTGRLAAQAPTPEKRRAAGVTSQCGAAMAADGSSSWTLAIPSQLLPRRSLQSINSRRQKKPRTLSGTGPATGGPPVLQARPVAPSSWAGETNAGPHLLRLTLRQNGLKDSWRRLRRRLPPVTAGLGVSPLPGRGQRQIACG